MCEPTTLATGAALLGVAGAGVSAYAQYRAGEASARQAENNARLADAAAADALARGERTQALLRRRLGQVVASQRVRYAAGGIDVSSRTVAAVAAATNRAVQEDVSTARLNAAREAWGLRLQGEAFRREAAAERERAGWAAGTTLLTSVPALFGPRR